MNFKSKLIMAGILLLAFTACKMQGRYGIKKDFSNGITTTYTNMEPAEVLRVMNGEIVPHNVVLLGESFEVINRDVKGLVVKDGKVSVGCSLVITDSNNKKILVAEDLFKGKDVWDKDKAKELKCTINTGKPMDWEQQYDIVVTFWDKYGNGKLENRLNVNIEDIP